MQPLNALISWAYISTYDCSDTFVLVCFQLQLVLTTGKPHDELIPAFVKIEVTREA